MEMHKIALCSGKPTERAVGWRVAAALKVPCFLVLAEHARNPPLLSGALAFVAYWCVSVRARVHLNPQNTPISLQRAPMKGPPH